MLLAHKIELRPTTEQAEYLDKACGSRRHAFNHLLAHFTQADMKWSKKAALAKYNSLRQEFAWYSEVSQRITRNAIDDLDNAFKHFFRRVKAKKKGEKAGFPKFKKRGFGDSFSLREKPKFDVIGRTLRIEKLKTRIKMREELRFVGVPCQVTISKKAGKYFASILVETIDYNPHLDKQAESVGVDFGIKDLAICSNGQTFGANQKLKNNLKKLARKQRKLSRKVKGSNRYAKAKQAVAKLHYRTANQRKAVLHHVSDYLTKRFKIITIEDLAVGNMLKNRKLSRAIADCGFYELRRQIEYKAKLRDCHIVVADRFFASSKTCACCGQKKQDLTLADRAWRCECGATHDRDQLAAFNLDNYGRATLQLDLKPYTRAVSDVA